MARDWDGDCYTQDVQWTEGNKTIDSGQWGITQLTSIDKPGLSTEPGVIHRGSNSGYQALNLSIQPPFNATRILLLGFDMMLDGKKRHWFGEHPKPMCMASNYVNFINHFKTIDPTKYGIEIWNLSRQTALTCFPCHSLDDL